MGITENDLYNNEDKIEEADDNDEFGINTEENMAEDDDGENTVDDKGNVEMVEEKGDEDSDDEVLENASESDEKNKDGLTSPNGILCTTRTIPVKRRQKNTVAEAPRVIA